MSDIALLCPHNEIYEECQADYAHNPADFFISAGTYLQHDIADKAKGKAAGDAVGQRHHNDGQEGRYAVSEVGKVNVLDGRNHQKAGGKAWHFCL